MKRWWILGLLATIFTGLGVLLGLLLGRDDPAGLAVGGVFLAVGLFMWWSALRMRREEHLDGATPPEPAPGGRPWAEVVEAVRRFAGTPFVVESEGSVIRVHADLADATFLAWASAHRVRMVHLVEAVATRSGEAITRDVARSFRVDAGVGRLGASASQFSGRSWSWTRRIELGVGTDGSVGRQVDINFSPSAIRGPVEDVLRETGWRTTWWRSLPAEARGGVVMGAVGAIGALVTVVVIAVQALT